MLQYLLPTDYYDKCLETDYRPDGRKIFDYREIQISSNISTCNKGSVLVKIGNSLVTCALQPKICLYDKKNPYKMTLNEILKINISISHVCIIQNKNGMSSNEFIQYMIDFLLETFESTNVLNIEDLIGNNNFIQLICEIVCVNDDGNLNDTLFLSLCSALKSAKIPNLHINKFPTIITEQTLKEIPLIPLKLCTTPISITFIEYDNKFILDPTAYEENLADGKFIAVLERNNIKWVYKTGKTPLDDIQRKKLIETAVKQAQHMTNLMLKLQ